MVRFFQLSLALRAAFLFSACMRTNFLYCSVAAVLIHSWKRAGEGMKGAALFKDGVAPGDVIQGALGDCWLLGAMSVLAVRDTLLHQLFKAAYPAQGIYVLQFFKGGAWQEVIIDDLIPCGVDGTPAYARCSDPSELWVQLLEKAYAKVHGCYEALDGGSVAEALADLSGGLSEKLSLGGERAEDCSNDALWKLLCLCKEEAWLMGAALSGEGFETEGDNGEGLLWNHAYGLMGVEIMADGTQLVHLRNPWGQCEWTGDWSDHSERWTPAVRKMLGYTPSDDGSFYMSWADFTTRFNKVYVCRLYKDDIGDKWHEIQQFGRWEGDTAGGCTNFPTWPGNPQYIVTTQVPDTQLFISLQQPDLRLEGQATYDCSIGFYLMKHDDAKRRKRAISSNDEIVFRSVFTPGRDVAAEVTLEPHATYVIIPCTFDAGRVSDFLLSIFCEHSISFNAVQDEQKVIAKAAWKEDSAGGCMNTWRWRLNPQILLESPVGQHVTLSLVQDINPPFFAGFYGVLLPESSAQSPTRRTLEADPDDVITKVTFTNAPSVSTSLEVAAGRKYALIPCTFDVGQEASFEMQAFALEPVSLRLIQPEQDWKRVEISSAWTEGCAGGCKNNASWSQNPRLHLQVSEPTQLTVVLAQDSTELCAGMYLGATEEALTSNTFTAKSAFIPADSVSLSCQLSAQDDPFILLPCTFEANQFASFKLLIFSDITVKVSLH